MSRWICIRPTGRDTHGWDYYYYGHLTGQSNTPGARDERAWRSFDHRPRFNNNYVGLRNRIAILSEAYAYSTFQERITATSRFIDEVLSYAHAHAARIKKLTEAADSRRIVGTQVSLRADMFRGPELIEVLLGEVAAEKHPVDGHVMEKRVDVRKPERVATIVSSRRPKPSASRPATTCRRLSAWRSSACRRTASG